MWCVIGVDFPMKMTSFSFYVLLILSFVSFVNSKPATTFVVPDYPPQLSLFARFDNPKHKDAEVPLKFTNRDDFANWASYAMRVMAAKINNTFFTFKDKMKKSVSNDAEKKTEPFLKAGNFTNSNGSNNDRILNNISKKSEDLKKMGFVQSDAASNVTPTNVVPTDMIPVNMVTSNTMPTNVVPTNMMPVNMVPSNTMPTNVVPTNMMPVNMVPSNTMPTNVVPTNMMPVNMVPSNTMSTNVVPTKMVPTNMLPTNMLPTNMLPTNTLPTNMPPTNILSITPASSSKDTPVIKSAAIKMSEKQIDLDSGKNDDSQKMVQAERRHFNLPTGTFGDSNLFNPHFSLTDDPRNYHPFANYLSHLLGNNHYDLNGNKIIIRTPDFFPAVPTPAAYIPLLLQHPGFSGYQGDQVVKNQFGGGDESKNTKEDLAALQVSTPSTPLKISAPPMTSIPSTTSTTTTTSTPSPKSEVEDFSKPIKLVDSPRESIRPSTGIGPIISVPFEAIITITRENHPFSSTPLPLVTPLTTTPRMASSLPITLNQDSRSYYEIVTRDPPDEFPPFFKRNNSLSNEFGTVDVVLADEVPIKNPDQNKQERKNDCDKNKNNYLPNESSTVNVVIENEIPTKSKNKIDKNNDSYQQNKFLDDNVNPEDEVPVRKNKNKKERSRKRQTSAFKQLLQILGFSKKKIPDNSTDIQLSASPVIKIFKGNRFPGAKFEETQQTRGRRNQTSESQESPENPDTPENEVTPINEKPTKSDDPSQNQEFDDDDEEEEGSLGSITDLLPLVIPVLEDLSDPESDTDLAELLEGAIPLLQGLSDGENDDGTPINIGATVSPILQAISAGKDGQDSDSGAIITPIISLVAPLIGPILGPVIGPLLRSSSNPNSEGSSLLALIQSISGPLSQPTEPGGTSPLSQLVAGIVAGLSKELSAGGNVGSDVGALISSIVSGTLAGTSAGLSGGSSSGSGSGSSGPSKPDSYGAYANYGPAPVPANSVNPLQLIGTTVKDILGAGVTVVSSVVGAVSGLLGASSAGGSSGDDSPAYGPPPPSYGPPNYKPPPLLKPPPINKPQKNTFNRPQ